jgi:hypothetical protein
MSASKTRYPDSDSNLLHSPIQTLPRNISSVYWVQSYAGHGHYMLFRRKRSKLQVQQFNIRQKRKKKKLTFTVKQWNKHVLSLNQFCHFSLIYNILDMWKTFHVLGLQLPNSLPYEERVIGVFEISFTILQIVHSHLVFLRISLFRKPLMI